VRRGTSILLIALLVMILAAAVAQFVFHLGG
jgi:hypothetical protein